MINLILVSIFFFNFIKHENIYFLRIQYFFKQGYAEHQLSSLNIVFDEISYLTLMNIE